MIPLMKNVLCLLTVFFGMNLIIQLQAQTAKRFPLVELFTNTPCPICNIQNPGFFELMDEYPDQLHQISFYPGRPYQSCPLYLANQSENITRMMHRDINGTPTVHVDGGPRRTSASVSQNDINQALANPAAISTIVEETTGTDRTVHVTIHNTTADQYEGVVYVVVAERYVELVDPEPSWEKIHHNVFRKFLTPSEGIPLTIDVLDQTFTFSYSIDATWDANEIYALAWIENPADGTVYNSGTRFDDNSATTDIGSTVDKIWVSPNPVDETLTVHLTSGARVSSYHIVDMNGKTVMTMEGESSTHDVSNLATGQYILTAELPGRIAHQLFMKL